MSAFVIVFGYLLLIYMAGPVGLALAAIHILIMAIAANRKIP